MGLDRQLRRANRYVVTRQQEAIQSVPKVKLTISIAVIVHRLKHYCRIIARYVARLSPRPLNAGDKRIPDRKSGGREFFVRGHAEKMMASRRAAPRRRATREREQTIVQIAPYFMITHVQTALRKAGNYDKTGRTRKNMRAARFSCTLTKGERDGGRGLAGGARWRGGHVALGSSR